MRETISCMYEITCDICGRKEHITDRRSYEEVKQGALAEIFRRVCFTTYRHVDGWYEVAGLDICEHCYDELDSFIKRMREKEEGR